MIETQRVVKQRKPHTECLRTKEFHVASLLLGVGGGFTERIPDLRTELGGPYAFSIAGRAGAHSDALVRSPREVTDFDRQGFASISTVIMRTLRPVTRGHAEAPRVALQPSMPLDGIPDLVGGPTNLNYVTRLHTKSPPVRSLRPE